MTKADGLLLDVGVVLFKSAWEIADDYERIRGLPRGTVVGRGPLDPGGMRAGSAISPERRPNASTGWTSPPWQLPMALPWTGIPPSCAQCSRHPASRSFDPRHSP